jgi:hypothetical protein
MDGMTVENIHRLGLLIKTWATGKSYFDGTGPGSVSRATQIQGVTGFGQLVRTK